MRKLLHVVAFLLSGCVSGCPPEPKPKPTDHQLTIENNTATPTVVYVSFGADSAVNATSWSICGAPDAGTPLNCSFGLAPGVVSLALGGAYMNATVAFGAPVGCGSTKAELNINNPNWYDIVDVSLVDGYSNKIRVLLDNTVLGPPAGATGNADMLGVFPYGCDICTARQSPPCGIPTGTDGCKAGTQYAPTPPCQFQGQHKGGGSLVKVSLVE